MSFCKPHGVLDCATCKKGPMACGHYKNVCSCGAIISQCRCMGPKAERVIQDGCLGCARRTENAITPSMGNDGSAGPKMVSVTFALKDAVERLGHSLRDEDALNFAFGEACSKAMSDNSDEGIGAIARRIGYHERMETIRKSRADAQEAIDRAARDMVKP